MKTKFLLLIFLAFTFVISSCGLFTEDNIDLALGWLGDDENTEEIEDDVNLPNFLGTGSMPSSTDLTPYFPPIGDQGQYGTCVAWAVGYNHKSFLEAKVDGRTNYTSTSQIFSPKDLFWAIDNQYKGEDCNGTNFEYAYDVIQSRGIATIGTVPYTSLGDCSSSPSSSWTSEAGSHTISSYREISVDKDIIKSYLADGRAVVFGAKLGDEFMEYTGGVLDYQTYGYTGQHAYHAMILAGYDDSKGTNGAFKVVNSWGTSWGESGIAWVDQDYFCTDDFCFCAFVATDSQTDPDTDGDNQVDDPSSGYDLIAWELYDYDYYDVNNPDYSDNPRWRTSYYNVYNSGETTLNASDDWSIVYLLYNAYDGDDYQIVLFDYYSDDYGTYGSNDAITDANLTGLFTSQGYWYNYVDVVSGQSVANAVAGSDSPFSWSYKMPYVTGSYYLVIIADAFDTYAEYDESNNYAYFTADYNEPLEIENGIITNVSTKSGIVLKDSKPVKGQDVDNQTVVSKKNLNAYTTDEITQMIRRDLKSGEIQKKVVMYELNNSINKTSFKN